MKSLVSIGTIGLAACLALSCDVVENKSGIPVNEDIWINGFLASWHHNPETELINSGFITTGEIDWDAMTHLTYYSLSISPEGRPLQSLDPQVRDNFNSDRLEAIVPAAHASGTDVLFSVGGSGTYESFQSAITPTYRDTLVTTLTDILLTYGFDGVNISMIPIETSDFANFTEFIELLGTTLEGLQTSRGRKPLMTATVLKSEQAMALFGQLHHHFEQIHLLSYELAQPWRATLAWHGSALYNRRYTLRDSQVLLPSVDEFVRQAIANGIPRGKLGMGVTFSGSVWEGATLRDTWPSWPDEAMSILRRISYQELLDTWPAESHQWDSHAEVPYLEFDDSRRFVSFENSRSIERKVTYAEQERLGGVMVWDIGSGFLDQQPAGNRNPLMRALKEATFTHRNR